VIAERFLDIPVTVKGGGRDLIFPHHEFSAGHTAALTGKPLAGLYSHTGLVAYRGEKMSKSLGNLVLVSDLVAGGADPRAIRLAILAQPYRSDWEWTDELLDAATQRLARWVEWAARPASGTDDVRVDELRAIIADDLDTPGAIRSIDGWIAAGSPATAVLSSAIDALVGIRLG
jgi:L-cysteine:1D-myo-inositol 2-amino-2-deoxy-alpha-D-glucopyranoside ligase